MISLNIFLKNSVAAVFLKGLNTALTLVVGAMLARMLGVENYGFYGFLISCVTLIGLPSKAGLPLLIVREVSKSFTQGRLDLLRGVLITSNVFVITYSIIAGVIALIIGNIYFESSNEYKSFSLCLLLLPLVALGNVRGAALRGINKPILGLMPEQLIRPMFFLLMLILLWLDGGSSTLEALEANLLSTFLAFMIGALLLLRFIPKNHYQEKPKFELKDWLLSLLPFSLFQGLSISNAQINLVLLGGLADYSGVALYQVGFQGAALVTFGLSAINSILAPQIVSLDVKGEKVALQRLITLCARLSALAALFVLIVFCISGEFLIELVFGEGYSEAYIALLVLAVGQFINACSGPVALVLNMTNNESKTIIGILVALGVNVLLCLALIPLFGFVGAAVASSTALCSWNFLLVYITYKRTGLNTMVITFNKTKHKI